MNCEPISKLLIPFVDGRADMKERGRVESHLQDCAVCRARVEQYRTVWMMLDEEPAVEPSFGFDARLRARMVAEPRSRWFGWMVPSPRLAFSTALLIALSAWISMMPPAQPNYQASLQPEKEFQMIKDLRVLENYDVVSDFDALSEMPAAAPGEPGATNPANDGQQQPQGTGTM
ncbi:MAG: zf-HC2 domain-containing protein [Candidatus Acidiferrales bacterium]